MARAVSTLLITNLARFVRAWSPVVLAGLLVASSASAAPTPTDKAVAQALFDDAIKLMANRRFDDARPKLEESERLDPALGTRYQLAQCYEALGRTASAWAAFLEVADLARAAGQGARERAARERAATMEAKVDRLVIDGITPDRVGLEVRRDDVVLGPAQWGVPIPVDPGVHHLTATAPSAIPWSSDVTISGSGETVHVRIPAFSEVVSLAPAPVLIPPRVREIEAPSVLEGGAGVRASTGSPGANQRVAGIVVGGAGLLALAAGTAIGVVAHSNYDSTGTHCQPAGCDAQGKDTTDSARRLGNVGTGVFVAGGVFAATGVVLWFTAPRGSRASVTGGSGASPAAVYFDVGPSAAFLRGRF
jgi:hypothetical protein